MSESQPKPQNVVRSRHRRRPVVLPERLSDDELAQNWSLSPADLEGLRGVRTRYRLANAVQLCALRLFGQFVKDPTHTPPRIVAHLSAQLEESPPLFVEAPSRKATRSEQQKTLLDIAGFQRFDEDARSNLEEWIKGEARHGDLPATLLERSERRLLRERVVLPAASTLDRLVSTVCSKVHGELFESIADGQSPALRSSIDEFLEAPLEEQRSFFARLKEYPPSPTLAAMKRYLSRYRELSEVFELGLERPAVNTAFVEYLSDVARGYNARDLKRFNDPKRYALMACFLQERRKTLLDHLVEMHDKFLIDMCRDAKSAHEDQYRALRRRQKAALDAVIRATHALLDWPENESRTRDTFCERFKQTIDLLDTPSVPVLKIVK